MVKDTQVDNMALSQSQWQIPGWPNLVFSHSRAVFKFNSRRQNSLEMRSKPNVYHPNPVRPGHTLVADKLRSSCWLIGNKSQTFWRFLQPDFFSGCRTFFCCLAWFAQVAVQTCCSHINKAEFNFLISRRGEHVDNFSETPNAHRLLQW